MRGRVLAIHGLNANKNLLNLLSYALADSGLEVFTIDLPGHGQIRRPVQRAVPRTFFGTIYRKR